MKISCIYSIINKVNGKFYYGSTNNFNKRRSEHFSKLKKNKHCNIHLQRAYNKHGIDNFVMEMVKEVSIEQLLSEEQKYLEFTMLNPEKYYNIATCAEASKRGLKHGPLSQEHKENISKAGIGRKLTDKTKQKLSLAKLGEKHPNSKLNDTKVLEIIKHLKDGILTQTEIGKLYGVTDTAISQIKTNKRWTHIPR